MNFSKVKILKTVFIICGTISLILGIIGIVVPGLPTAPFLLLTAFLYYKGSEKLYNKITGNHAIGKKIRQIKENKGITVKMKIYSLLTMWAMLAISSYLTGYPFFLLLILLGNIGTLILVFKVPTKNY